MTGPVFIIGCPRSGTTLLLDLLAGTRAFAYVNAVGPHLADRWKVDGRTRIYDLPVVGDALFRHRRLVVRTAARPALLSRLARRALPEPIEPWEFWTRLLPNFRPEFSAEPPADPSPAELDVADRDRAREMVAALTTRQRRGILLSKYTDFPRIELLLSVFPDARFVHIRRDAHAVATSYAVEIETDRFGTWAFRDWWSQGWPPAAADHWRETGATKLGFAAHNRNYLVGLIDDAVAEATAPTACTTYEELTDRPADVVDTVLRFSQATARADVDRLVGSRSVSSSNHRWRATRTETEAALLDEILSPAAPWRVP